MSPAERLEIQRTYLAESGATIASIAQHFGRTRETIAACLKGKDFDWLKAQVHAETAEEARGVLKRNSLRAAKKWSGEAIDVATRKGNHKPMRHLLEATGVIENQDGSSIVVQLGSLGTDQFEIVTPTAKAGEDAAMRRTFAAQLDDLKRKALEPDADVVELQQALRAIIEAPNPTLGTHAG